MTYVIIAIISVFAGSFSVYFLLEVKRRTISELKSKLDTQQVQINEKEVLLNQEAEKLSAEFKSKLETQQVKISEKELLLKQQTEKLSAELAKIESQVISYNELFDENKILKRDLQNVDVNLRKLQLDTELQNEKQNQLDEKCSDLAKRYLNENVKVIGISLNQNNFSNCKSRLQKVIERCRSIGFDIAGDEETGLLDDLKVEYEKVVRAAIEREEQARIKSQIREEQKLEKEIERELKQLEREREAIQVALDKALTEAKDKHSDEVTRLQDKLSEAEEKSRRATSRAQMTKSGHVYVISNIGSFGEGVFKIGMTRRLEPIDRVKELGDASVPFRFDVHMMISSDDAPSLENALHRSLHKLRVNKVNPRKEFFRTEINDIYKIVNNHHGEVQYIADAEALEYRQSLEMSDEDSEYIENVYNKIESDDRENI